jgi:hypothetical protein
MCLPVSCLFWVSSLAYPNLLGTKGYVVVVAVVKIAHDLNHLDLESVFEQSAFDLYPHTYTLDHVCMLFSSMDPCFDFTI